MEPREILGDHLSSSFVSELYDYHQEICDVKFVLPRRKSKGDNKGDVVADVVCAHNVVVVSYTRSPMLKEMYEKHKNNRDYEFCVRIPVEIDVSIDALQLFVTCLYGKLQGKICDIFLLKDVLGLHSHFQVPFAFVEKNLPLKPSCLLALSEKFLDDKKHSSKRAAMLKR